MFMDNVIKIRFPIPFYYRLVVAKMTRFLVVVEFDVTTITIESLVLKKYEIV